MNPEIPYVWVTLSGLQKTIQEPVRIKGTFTLLGDPALRLAYPWHGTIITDSVNSISVSENTDSLKALSFITISGHIEDNDGNLMNDF